MCFFSFKIALTPLSFDTLNLTHSETMRLGTFRNIINTSLDKHTSLARVRFSAENNLGSCFTVPLNIFVPDSPCESDTSNINNYHSDASSHTYESWLEELNASHYEYKVRTTEHFCNDDGVGKYRQLYHRHHGCAEACIEAVQLGAEYSVNGKESYQASWLLHWCKTVMFIH